MNKAYAKVQNVDDGFSEDDHLREEEEERRKEEQCRELYRKLKPGAISLTKSIEDAEELIQETLYRGLRYKKDFEGVEDVLAYLFIVMKHAALNKKNQEEDALQQQSFDDEETGEELKDKTLFLPADQQQILEDEEFIKRVLIFAGDLEVSERYILVMWLKHWSYEEMAGKLGISLQRVKVKFGGLKAKLRYRLRDAPEKGLF